MKRRTLLKILPLSTAMAILPRAEAWPGTEHAGMENSNAAREPFIGNENNGIVEGAARFTVISAYCIRMEYAAKNGFVDAPTLFAYDRRRRLDGVEVLRENGTLRIRTKMISIVYRPDGKQFHPGNLSVTFDSGERKFTWEPGQKNSKNLGGPVPTLDGVGAPFALPDGLLSRDGWYLLDDSGQPVLIDGWIHQRAGGGPQGENESPMGTTIRELCARWRGSRDRFRCPAGRCTDPGIAAGFLIRPNNFARSSEGITTMIFPSIFWLWTWSGTPRMPVTVLDTRDNWDGQATRGTRS
jgi:hypothetical protein